MHHHCIQKLFLSVKLKIDEKPITHHDIASIELSSLSRHMLLEIIFK